MALPLRALWRYRGFVAGMVAREFRARYLHSLLGATWAILNPLAMIIIYTVVFAQVMRARLPGVDDGLRLQHLPVRRRAAVDVLHRAADAGPSPLSSTSARCSRK